MEINIIRNKNKDTVVGGLPVYHYDIMLKNVIIYDKGYITKYPIGELNIYYDDKIILEDIVRNKDIYLTDK
jgi:hypothetical protein